jgi:hypothetical protein
MIWHKQALDLSGMPEGTSATLVGEYNIENTNLIEIYLSVEQGGNVYKLLLYNHNPSMLAREEPSKDDVMSKYAAKIKKCVQRYKTYEDIKNKLP